MPEIDVYARVTNALIEALEAGTRPWLQPWVGGNPMRPLRANGEPYRGVNVIMLWAAAANNGFSSPHWVTFKQAQEFGGNVKRGQKGTFVVYVSQFTRTETDASGNDVERNIPFMKGYTVFNASQCENLPERFSNAVVLPPVSKRIDAAEKFFENTKAKIVNGGAAAFYNQTSDSVHIPPFETFHNAESHAATVAHELVHWTKHPSRLDRTGGKRFGDENYAIEELVAEIGSAFICAELGITNEVMPNHAAYIASWLRALKNDKRFIFSAASQAQKASDFLIAFQNKG